MDFTELLNFLSMMHPYVEYGFVVLGALVVIGTGIDKIIPDEIDKGFMKKIMNIPVLGSILLALCRFSPFTNK